MKWKLSGSFKFIWLLATFTHCLGQDSCPALSILPNSVLLQEIFRVPNANDFLTINPHICVASEYCAQTGKCLEPQLQQSVNDSAELNCNSEDGAKSLATYAYPQKEDDNKTAEAEDDHSETRQAPIATFDEWTKEKLKKKQMAVETEKPVPLIDPSTMENVVPLTTTTVKEVQSSVLATAKRNYASKECGAKVLYANAEAENKGAVLNDKERDDYMRNPCERAQNKFLVIELCETIQPTSVEVANFELFSSGPKTIRLSGSERYPTAEWIIVGEFDAADTRDIQSFPLNTRGFYAKFLKVELLSHYGKEHYCTLSTLRVFGISMVDEYEAEADSVVVTTSTTMNTQEGDKIAVDSVVSVESQTAGATTTTNVKKTEEIVIESQNANDPVVNIIEKMADVAAKTASIKSVVETTLAQIVGKAGQQPTTRRRHMSYARCGQCPTWTRGCTKNDLFCYVFASGRHLKDLPARLPPKNDRRKFRSNTDFIKFVMLPPRLVDHPDVVQTHIKDIPLAPQTPVQKAEQATPGHTDKAINHMMDNPIPGTSTNHKESVFLKLSKRLSALELNMSLSSEYLSELSRRYVAQADELNKQNERLLKAAYDNTVQVVEEAVKNFAEEIRTVKAQMKDMEARLLNVHPQVSPTSINALSIPKSPPRTEECHPPPLLFSEDVAWTTNQVISIAVGVQLVTVLLLLSVQLCARAFRQRPISTEQIRHIAQEECRRMYEMNDKNSQQRKNGDSGCKDNAKTRRKRKKKSPSDEMESASEPWDSAMDTSSSLAPLPTRTPSETSDTEAIFPTENMRTPQAHNPSLMQLMEHLPSTSKFDQRLRVVLPNSGEREPQNCCVTPQPVSPPWQTVPRRKGSNNNPKNLAAPSNLLLFPSVASRKPEKAKLKVN